MLPKATVSHSTAERLRIRVPRQKGNAVFFSNLETELKECEGVEAVRANPLTASVLIFHHITTEQILAYAKERELFEVHAGVKEEGPATEMEALEAEFMHGAEHSRVVKAITTRATHLGEKIEEATHRQFNLTGIAALSLFGMSLYQVFKKRDFLPDGGTLLWYAVRLILEEQHVGVRHGQ